jgi:hypothetical protein
MVKSNKLNKIFFKEIMRRTNLTNLNSRSGQVCCYIDSVSSTCRIACKSALFAPTLSHEQKNNRIKIICNKELGTEFQGDKVFFLLKKKFLKFSGFIKLFSNCKRMAFTKILRFY